MRHLALFLSLFALSLFLVPRSNAQINGAPSSVTSPGFGGRAVNGPPASVTSLGPRGYAPNPHVRFSTAAPGRSHNGNGNHDGHNRRHHYGEFTPPLMYAVPVPYAVDSGTPDEGYYDNADSDNDPNYQGGPTVFDRRGTGQRSYIPPVNDASSNTAQEQDSVSDTEPNPEPVDPTVLVFKDGHQLEVNNYAIVGATLFDLTPGHPRRIALADLNLDATRQQNDNRGVLFQLPPSAQAN